MLFPNGPQSRIDSLKLDSDLRDAYVELLSAQCAVERIKLRYTPQDIATSGSAFMLGRAIIAARGIWEYFSAVEQHLPPQAGVRTDRRQGPTSEKPL